LREEKSLTQVASEYGVHPNQLRRWKQTALEQLPSLFTRDSAAAEQLAEQLAEQARCRSSCMRRSPFSYRSDYTACHSTAPSPPRDEQIRVTPVCKWALAIELRSGIGAGKCRSLMQLPLEYPRS
jgi:hypothetical protein